MNEPEWPSLDFDPDEPLAADTPVPTGPPVAPPPQQAGSEAVATPEQAPSRWRFGGRDAVPSKRGAGRAETAADAGNRLQHVVAEDPSKLPLVPVGGVFEGQVAVQGQTRIEGIVRGTLRGTGRLELGPEARVEGHVECEEVCSEGAILGPIAARDRVELRPGAILDGDLETPCVKISDQACWNGKGRVGGR